MHYLAPNHKTTRNGRQQKAVDKWKATSNSSQRLVTKPYAKVQSSVSGKPK